MDAAQWRTSSLLLPFISSSLTSMGNDHLCNYQIHLWEKKSMPENNITLLSNIPWSKEAVTQTSPCTSSLRPHKRDRDRWEPGFECLTCINSFGFCWHLYPQCLPCTFYFPLHLSIGADDKGFFMTKSCGICTHICMHVFGSLGNLFLAWVFWNLICNLKGKRNKKEKEKKNDRKRLK